MRTLSPEDVEPLCEITRRTNMFRDSEIDTLREVFEDFLAGGNNGGHECLVDTSEAGSLQGFVYYAPAAMTDRAWYVYWIVVDATVQGRGIGSRMLAAAETAIAAADGRLILIETSGLAQYEPTRTFYLRNDYYLSATVGDYYADGDDMVIFAKRTDAGSRADPSRIG